MPRSAALPACLPVLAAMILTMTGCGTTPPVHVVPAVALPDVTGNWQMQTGVLAPTAAPAPPTTPRVLFYGSLTQTGGTVSGVGHMSVLGPVDFGCLPAVPVSVSGTVDETHHLALASSTFNDSAVQFRLNLPADLHTFTDGTVSVTGKCAVSSASAIGAQFAPLTGVYTGNLQHVDVPTQVASGPVGATTATLTQAAADPDGTFPVTGTIKVSFPECSVTVPVTGRTTGVATELGPTPVFNGNLPPAFTFLASETPEGSRLTLTSLSLDTHCAVAPDTHLTGTLVRQ